jgi:AraC-like DNA-binding protein
MRRNTVEREEWPGSRGEFLIERHTANAMNAAHWHDHVELNLLLEGRMTYLLNGRLEQIEAGRLVLFWAAIPHQTIAVDANSPLICIYLPLVNFLALPIDRQVRQSVMQGRLLRGPDTQTNDLRSLPLWEEEWRAGNPARQRLVLEEVQLRIRRLMLDSCETSDPETLSAPAPPVGHAVRHVELLTDLINSRHSNPLSLPDLARLAGMHTSTINKAFRDVLGITANEYLIRYRIARAMQRLADTDQPVLQVGFECGFGSVSRFYEIFKARTGITPRQFRESSNKASGPM